MNETYLIEGFFLSFGRSVNKSHCAPSKVVKGCGAVCQLPEIQYSPQEALKPNERNFNLDLDDAKKVQDVTWSAKTLPALRV